MNNETEDINLNLSDDTKPFQERIDEIRGLVEENLRYTKTLHDSMPAGGIEEQQKLQKLLQENLKISQELYEMTKKIKRWVAWQRIWGWLKIVIILVPIVLGIIYLPPLMRELLAPLLEAYQNVLGLTQSAGQSQGIIDQLMNQFQGGQ